MPGRQLLANVISDVKRECVGVVPKRLIDVAKKLRLVSRKIDWHLVDYWITSAIKVAENVASGYRDRTIDHTLTLTHVASELMKKDDRRQ